MVLADGCQGLGRVLTEEIGVRGCPTLGGVRALAVKLVRHRGRTIARLAEIKRLRHKGVLPAFPAVGEETSPARLRQPEGAHVATMALACAPGEADDAKRKVAWGRVLGGRAPTEGLTPRGYEILHEAAIAAAAVTWPQPVGSPSGASFPPLHWKTLFSPLPCVILGARWNRKEHQH